MSENALTVPAAGWYPEGNDGSIIRWWDGAQWTEHTRVIEATSVAPYGAGTQQPTTAKNTLATLAMIFSIVSFGGLLFLPFLFLGIAGLIIGIVALRRVRRFEPGAARRGHAIAGIVVGALSLVTMALLTVAAVGVYQHAHQTDATQSSPQSGYGGSGGSTPDDSSLFETDHAGADVPYTLPVIEQNMAIDFRGHYGYAVSQIQCDSEAAFGPGDFFECVVTLADHSTARAQITMSKGTDGGYNMLVIDPPRGGDGSAGVDPPAGDDSGDSGALQS